MTKFKAAVTRFVRDEEGATAAEYGLIAALIAIVVIAGATTFGQSLRTMFQGMSGTVASVKTTK